MQNRQMPAALVFCSGLSWVDSEPFQRHDENPDPSSAACQANKRIEISLRAEPLCQRGCPSLANFKDQHLLVSGGMSNEYKCLQTMDIYDIKNDRWTTGPAMQTPRIQHSSCVLSNFVYVFFGFYEKDTINKIERFDAEAYLHRSDASVGW